MTLRRTTYLLPGALGLLFWSVGVLLVRYLAPQIMGTWASRWGLVCLALTLFLGLVAWASHAAAK